MEAKFLAGALSFLSIFLAIYAQSVEFEHFDSEASTEFEIEPVVIYYGDSNVNIGEPFSITCIIPITDQIHWLKNGEPITRHNLRHGRDEHAYMLEETAIEGEKHKIEAHITVRHALMVHEGRYQCNEKHSTYHMLHVRNAPVTTKTQTKTSGRVDHERHYPTESGYQTMIELTPSTLDDFFTRAWEHPGSGGDVHKMPAEYHHNKQKEQQLKERERGREYERRKHLYVNATLAHGLGNKASGRSGESDEVNSLGTYAYPTSKYNEVTTSPWHGTPRGDISGRGSINRVYSATPPDFPPPRLNMLDHTVAPPDAPEIYYPHNMPHQPGTHQHMITANNNPVVGGGGGVVLPTETQQQQTHFYTVAPGSVVGQIAGAGPPSSGSGTGTTFPNVVSHHAHAHLQPQLTTHHYHQQQSSAGAPPQQIYPNTQLQAPQPPIMQTIYQTMNPYQPQPPQLQQPPAPPFHHHHINQQQQQTPVPAYPPQFVNAFTLPTSGYITSIAATPTAILSTSLEPMGAATNPLTNFGTMQQAKTILPLKKDSDVLEAHYDDKVRQMKFFEIRSPLVLSCGLKGNASLDKILWFKNETSVQDVPSLKGRFRLIPAEGKFIIDKTDPNDDGLYHCNYENLKKDVKAVARVIVRVPSNSGVVEGEKLLVTCTVLGTDPKLSWTFGNLTLTNSTGRYVLKPDGNKIDNAILSIENISLNDKGEYKCIGSNEASLYGGYNNASDVTIVRVKGKLAALWPFLGICAEVLILCLIILIYEKRRNKSELEESDTDPQEQKKKRRNYD